MTSADLEEKLTAFADDLIARARLDATPLDQAVKIFKELREFYAATLTRDPEKGDKPTGRRPTMSEMRKRISLVDGGDRDGRAEPAVQDPGD